MKDFINKIKIGREWDKIWNSTNHQDIISFFYSFHKGSQKFSNQEILKGIRSEFRGNLDFWKLFNKWKREIDQTEIEISNIYQKIQTEIKKFPFRDKIQTDLDSNKILHWVFKFENGESVDLYIDGVCNLIFNGERQIIKYKLGYLDQRKFINLANSITDSKDLKNRPEKEKSKYDKLVNIIKIREEQLKKMDNNDPNKKLLQNELDSYKEKVSKMKQGKFESLKFIDFKNI